MALRASGDDYEHSAIVQPNQQVRPTGPRAAFRGEWVDQKQAEPFRTIAVSGQVIDIIADGIADEMPDGIKLKPSEYVAMAHGLMDYIKDRGFVIARA